MRGGECAGLARRRLCRHGATVRDGSLRAVHVYFPDPWWKKRHKKRRVFTASLVADIVRSARDRRRLRWPPTSRSTSRSSAGSIAASLAWSNWQPPLLEATGAQPRLPDQLRAQVSAGGAADPSRIYQKATGTNSPACQPLIRPNGSFVDTLGLGSVPGTREAWPWLDLVEHLTGSGWILPGDAGAAKPLRGEADRARDRLDGKIAQASAPSSLAILACAATETPPPGTSTKRRGEQLVAAGHVDPVIARRDDRRAGDAEVDLAGAAAVADLVHQGPHGRGADDAVFDEQAPACP